MFGSLNLKLKVAIFVLSLDLFETEMEREDEEGRLEHRIPAPWDKQQGAPGQPPGGQKKTKKEERNRRRSMKVHSKDKIGNIDINVLQRELCGSHSPPLSDFNRADGDISSARRRHLRGRTPSLLRQDLHSAKTNGESSSIDST